MNKPKPPKKPSRNDSPPEKTKNINYYLLKNTKDGIYIYSEPDACKFEEECNIGGLDMYQYADKIKSPYWFDDHIRYLQFLDLIDLKNKFKFENFDISPYLNYDGYHVGTIISVDTPNKAYESELKTYNNRFEQYEKDMVNYKLELSKFENYKKELKIKSLEMELENLKDRLPGSNY